MEPRTMATGLRFPEGPVWLGPHDVLVTEIQGQCLTRCRDGATEVIARTGGGPNGAARARDGSFLVANNGGVSVGPGGYWFSDGGPADGSVQRVTLGGAVSDVVAAFPAPIARPNDLCFGPDGKLYVTDPHNWEDLANLGPGRVWRMDPDGSNLELLTETPQFPNGLAFSADDGALLVAMSISQEVLAFPWTPAGLGEPGVFCKLPSGFPDGMCVAADGSVIVCGSMGHVIHVFDAEGAHVRAIDMPDGTEPTNCCIGDGNLYVTLSGTGELVALELGLDPLPLYD